MMMKKRFSLHVCQLSKDCRQYDPPNRVHLNTPWFHLALALTPGSRFAGRIDMEKFRASREVVPIEKDRWISFRRK